MALDIAEIVSVTDRLVPAAVSGSGQDKTLFVRAGLPGTPAADATAEAAREAEVRTYSSLTQVSDDFDATDSAYQAAQTYFSQSPYPGEFATGAFYPTGRVGLFAGRITATQAQYRAAQSFTFFGETVTIAASGTRTAAAVEQAIQTALGTALPGTAVVDIPTVPTGTNPFDSVITIVIPADVAASHNVRVDNPIGGVNSDVFFGVTGGDYVPPIRTHSNSISNALDDFRTDDDSWYFVTIDNSLVAGNAEAVSAYAEANRKFFVVADDQASALAANDTTSRFAVMNTAERSRTAGIYSGTADFKDVSLAALFSGVDYSSAGTVVTANLAALPGTAPDSLSDAQLDELRRKQVNFYTGVAGTSVLREGWTFGASAAGRWADARAFADWMVVETQRRVFNLLRSNRRVAFTSAGLQQVASVITRVCEQGVRNGGIAPGGVGDALRSLIAQVTGNSDFDGTLTSGYLVYTPPIASISEANRDARTASGYRVFVNGSGAIHNVGIDITFR